MAEFKVHELEGTRYVDIQLNQETVRAESGALCYMVGNIDMYSYLMPSIGGLLTSVMVDEAVYRPTYTGTGTITLESSLGGFHILDLNNEEWILEKGAYWASDGSVSLGYHREGIYTSFWAGEGFVYLQTKVKGYGKVVVTTRGPVEEITLKEGEEIVVGGHYVICRTAEVSMKIRRPTKNIMGVFTSGEKLMRVFTGPGRVLLNPAPYWRYFLLAQRGGKTVPPSHFGG